MADGEVGGGAPQSAARGGLDASIVWAHTDDATDASATSVSNSAKLREISIGN